MFHLRNDILWIDRETFLLDHAPQGFPFLVDEVLPFPTTRAGEAGGREWVHVLGTVLDAETGQRLTLGDSLWQLRLKVAVDQPRTTMLPPLFPNGACAFDPQPQPSDEATPP
ncbi:hypothetical protein [Rhizomonospora bruguierae]|uniref:hypothetical protein n=1 Tax=Rhizomonospora bruguierae TaxID=1581705 RepID=UPI001BCAC0CD|nr:hypothetical protein [Micromonospora sp. NBRC 107566]